MSKAYSDAVHGLASTVKVLYRDNRFLDRNIQVLRLQICPFDVLIRKVAVGSSVLDIGCGSGLFLGMLAYGGRISHGYGFDFDRSAIAAANKMKKAVGLRSELIFEHRDARFELPAGKFDVVSMIDTLHHLSRDDQKDLIERACSKVAPGGMLLYKDMANMPRILSASNRLHDLVVSRQWIQYRSISEVRDWVSDLGLHLNPLEKKRLFVYAHEYFTAERRITRS